MLNQKDIFELYKKYDVSASKRFGQNFLHNQSVLNKTIEAANVKGKDVIEIGPGLGSLTLPLLEVAKSVTSFEIDNDMVKVLSGEIQNDKLNLVEGDFLDQELEWEGKRPIVANIPYNITSDILFKLFRNTDKIESATLLMQKEVAERLLAPVGSKNYGKLTISTQIFAEVEKVVVVPPSSFIPAPKVTSMVVKLTFKTVDYADSKGLLEFIKNCFAMRRKTLFNNLRNSNDAEKSKQVIQDLNLKESVRPQELTKEQFIELYKKMNH